MPFSKLACDFHPCALLNKMRRKLVTVEDLKSVQESRTALEWLEFSLINGDRDKSNVAQGLITEIKYYFVSIDS